MKTMATVYLAFREMTPRQTCMCSERSHRMNIGILSIKYASVGQWIENACIMHAVIQGEDPFASNDMHLELGNEGLYTKNLQFYMIHANFTAA